MPAPLTVCALILVIAGTSQSVSSKVDFVEEDDIPATVSSTEDEDVEVKHTIVLSTKLKNNNRRGLVNNESGALTYNIGKNTKTTDSGEIPVVKAYKSVEITRILTPDTRQKTPVYTNRFPENGRSRDEIDLYPNLAVHPPQWKPSTFYKNINNWNPEYTPFTPDYQKFQRRLSDDGVKEFYCKKCRELNGISRGCVQEKRSSWMFESTTPKIKIDGKIAKFN